MTPSCVYEGCTIDTTGRCVLGNAPEECPNRTVAPSVPENEPESVESVTAAVGSPIDDASTEMAAAPLVSPPSARAALPVARQLGSADLSRIGARSGYRLIGILGAPNAGKTAALVSLYLLAANDELQGLSFRNSESLFAFNELAAGARSWDDNGGMLEQMTEHTELADPRRPGFLHLRLFSNSVGDSVDLVFPDLPGEWTDGLIDTSQHERLQFLKFAQALWIFVDGSALADPERRQNAVSRIQRTLSRIRQFFDPNSGQRLILVVTRRDLLGEVPAAPIARITEEGERRGLSLTVIDIASFSSRSDVPSGSGVEALIEASLAPVQTATAPAGERDRLDTFRQMLAYRGHA